MRTPPGRSLVVAAVGLFVGGCLTGGCVGAVVTPMNSGKIVYARLPHHVPPSLDSTAFRFAMVHDVIHERYARHGPAYYRERERLAREKLPVLHPESETALALTDDIAVALDRTGRTDEAVALLRDKLKRQETIGLTGKDLYSSYANLGEFLVTGNLWAMLGGDAGARRLVEEGRTFLRKSLDVNPKAHFGREEWQIVAVDALLTAGNRPELLREVDLIGNLLNIEIKIDSDRWRAAPYRSEQAVFGRPYHQDFTDLIYSASWRDQYQADLESPAKKDAIRQFIYEVGAETPFDKTQKARGRRAPFDEPALWLVGEWRQGSGPSPHLALCLGEIMFRVGQRYLAWTCFERAARLADRFSPREDLRRALVDHCRVRQTIVEKSIPSDEANGLRPKFEAELAFGETYQRDVQAYTEQKIADRNDVNDPRFFDEFHTGRPPIASKVGPEEWYAGQRRGMSVGDKVRAFLAWGALTGGAFVLILALVQRARFRPSPSV